MLFCGKFSPNGKQYLPYQEEDLSQYTEEKNKIFRAKSLLKAAFGKISYSKALADKDLSQIIYFYATNDENVGALNPSEITFLRSKQVAVYATETGHGHLYRRVVDALYAGKINL